MTSDSPIRRRFGAGPCCRWRSSPAEGVDERLDEVDDVEKWAAVTGDADTGEGETWIFGIMGFPEPVLEIRLDDGGGIPGT